MTERARVVSCNHEHIGIEWAHPGPCPLCACLWRIEELESALRAAANSLGTLAVASRHNGIEDMIDVRGYAHSRWTVARALLSEERARMIWDGVTYTEDGDGSWEAGARATILAAHGGDR